MRIEILVLKENHAYAAGFGQTPRVTSFYARSSSGCVHRGTRHERNALVLDVIELLDELHDGRKVVTASAGVQGRCADKHRENQSEDSERRFHRDYLFFFGLLCSIPRSGTPNWPSSLLNFSKSMGPIMFTILNSLGSMLSTTKPPI